MNSPLRWLLWEGIFFLFEGWKGAFFRFKKKKKYLSHLNVWLCTAFLFWQLCNCGTIANTQHKPDFHELYVRRPFTPGSHILRLQCVCSPCAVCKRCGSSTDCAFTQESTTDPWPFTTNTLIHYFDFKSKNCYWKCFFSIVILFFLHSTVIQYFIDVFKHNTYKKRIIQRFLLFYIYF